MQRPLLQVNSLTPQDLRVQFWCSSNASAQSASPSHTQSWGMHFLWGGRLFTQVNSASEHVRLAAKTKESGGIYYCNLNTDDCDELMSQCIFGNPGIPNCISTWNATWELEFFLCLVWLIHIVWSESPAEAQGVQMSLAPGILLLDATLVRHEIRVLIHSEPGSQGKDTRTK